MEGSPTTETTERPAAGAATAPPAAEFAALRSGALLVAIDAHGWLQLRGADRVDFLHGQVSNDVRGLQAGSHNRSLLLNHKGHALADMRVMRGEDRVDLVVEGGALELVERSLRQHIIFDQVELTRPAQWRLGFTLQGPEAEEVAARAFGSELPAEGAFGVRKLVGWEVTILRSRRTAHGGFDLFLHGSLQDGAAEDGSQAGTAEQMAQPAADLAAALGAAGAVAGGMPALRLGRVCAGVPSAAEEAGEGVLPQEAGLEPLVSYRKGCYLGQEIMARIEARGKLRRELGALRLEREPEPGEREVRRDGRLVGRLGTVARHPELGVLALAVVRSDLEPAAPVVAGGVAARRVELPLAEAQELAGPAH